MLRNNLGYPRVGPQREMKKACEQYWEGKMSYMDLLNTAYAIEAQVWKIQESALIDLIPCNDFSFYDQVLDMIFLLDVIPDRYSIISKKVNSQIDLYFAMARGYQKDGLDITPMEMTKWFDTNYHYIVPEFKAHQQFSLSSESVFSAFTRAKKILTTNPKPVLIGPISFLLLGKEKEKGFDRLDLLQNLLPPYISIINKLNKLGAEWIQLDEPYLVTDLNDQAKHCYEIAYRAIANQCPGVKIFVATYFDSIGENSSVAVHLPIAALHLDLVRAPQQLESILDMIDDKLTLSLGVIDGRNIWKNDYTKSLQLIEKAVKKIGTQRIMVSPSCSLLHVPFDLDFETEIDVEMKNWMAFAKQKLKEVSDLVEIVNGKNVSLALNQHSIESRRHSPIVHNPTIKKRVASIVPDDFQRKNPFSIRQKIQRTRFNLPKYPTTTIGSFPQTPAIRQLRAKLRKSDITTEEYDAEIKKAIIDVIRWQEEIGLDVLVHGEFERNDMVEYFGELLDGFLFTKNGWVTSYGSRCVKPPVIFGDIYRPFDMTIRWSSFAQSQTQKLIKGMLTGPVTILQWSFVRDDQPRSETCNQIALAIRDEVIALERAGLRIIQIDEPAIREGLPLHHNDWDKYLQWAVKAFKIASCGVCNETQIHTHMCYSEFNDIIKHIALMDADVITIENSRSQMELLSAFANFEYPNEIGPGVYDIHAPRIPSVDEIYNLIRNASLILPSENLWVNPDCGLKTRKWDETKASLTNMVAAAHRARQQMKS